MPFFVSQEDVTSVGYLRGEKEVYSTRGGGGISNSSSSSSSSGSFVVALVAADVDDGG